MSRIGKMPVAVPEGVDVALKQELISIKGKGGDLSVWLNELVKVTLDGKTLSFAPANDSREANAMSGTMRQLVNNMVVGVTKAIASAMKEKPVTLNINGAAEVETPTKEGRPS